MLNSSVSLWSDSISIEEGWGTQSSDQNYSQSFSFSKLATKVCVPNLLNKEIKKVNRP